MKWIFQKQDIVSAVSRVDAIIPIRSPRPIVRNVLIVAASDGTTEFIGTDPEIGMGIRVKIQAVSIEGPKKIALDAKVLHSHIQDSPSDQIEILSGESEEGEKYIINDGESKVALMGANADDYPDVANIDATDSISVNAGELARMLMQTQFSAAREEKKYAINGVNIKVSGKEIEIVATDGHRLAISNGKLNKKISKEKSAIMTLKMASELTKLCQDLGKDETVQLAIEERAVIVRGGSVVMSAQQVEGNFPRYKEVVPDNCDKKITINRNEFNRLLKRASVMISEETRAVNLSIEKGKMTMIARSAEKGEGEYRCDAEYTGEGAVKIAFTPAFLHDVIHILDSDNLEIELNSPERPVMIRKGDEFTYVIMPVRPR